MDAPHIDPAILKTVRKARKLGRPRLARLSGLTERQIARLEGGAPSQDAPTWERIERVSAALAVPPGVLTGDLPLTEDDLRPAAAHVCTNGCCA